MVWVPVVWAVSAAPGASDSLTGWATVALAVVTLVTLVATILITRADRRDADKRLRDERGRADAVRRRERQQDSAAGLLARIAGVMPYFDVVPVMELEKTYATHGEGSYKVREENCRDGVRALRFGADAQVAGLGDARAGEQYRALVHLVESVASFRYPSAMVATSTVAAGRKLRREAERGASERVSGDLRRWALFVRVSLESLVEHGESLDPGGPAPVLTRPGDDALWSPAVTPQAWLDAIRTTPGDPLYESAE